MIIRCPVCQTAFRCSTDQLQVAEGLVRCGACLHVFQATDEDSPDEEPFADDDNQGVLPFILEDDESLEDDREAALDKRQLGAVHRLRDRLELPAGPLRKRSAADLLRGIAIIGLTTTLALQYLWFNRHALGQQPTTRPWIETLCWQLPCELAPLRDVGAINSEALQIRSHPDNPQALRLSLRMSNQAGFDQPFPAIDLIFRDRQQQPVASRRLQPHDYLPEALSDRELFPAGTSVQVQLTLTDPGTDAVNYEIMFLPARPGG